MKRTIITVMAAAALLMLPYGFAVSQERLENHQGQVPQLVQVQMPGLKPVITGITPVGPDGQPFLAPV